MSHVTVTETPTVTAGAYSALDAVGGKLEFEDVRTAFSNHGHIVRAMLSDKGKQSSLLHLILFSEDFTATADNAAFAVSDADLLNVVAVIDFTAANYVDFDANSFCTTGFSGVVMELPFTLVEGGSSIFGQLFAGVGSTPTYTSTSDLAVTLHVA